MKTPDLEVFFQKYTKMTTNDLTTEELEQITQAAKYGELHTLKDNPKLYKPENLIKNKKNIQPAIITAIHSLNFEKIPHELLSFENLTYPYGNRELTSLHRIAGMTKLRHVPEKFLTNETLGLKDNLNISVIYCAIEGLPLIEISPIIALLGHIDWKIIENNCNTSSLTNNKEELKKVHREVRKLWILEQVKLKLTRIKQ